MARSWTLEIARDLIQTWTAKRVDLAVDRQGLTVKLEALESFILEQNPTSLEQAERLLDLMVLADRPAPNNYERLCRLQGFGRNDVGRRDSRVEVSFAPCAFGPFVGRA